MNCRSMRQARRIVAPWLLATTLFGLSVWPISARAKVEFDGSVGVGLAVYGLSRLPDDSQGTLDVGVAFDTRLGILINQRWGMHLVSSLGLTNFWRARELADKGLALGRGTTDAYRTVGPWMVVKDKYQPWRFMGGFIASAILLFGYIGSGLCFIAAPIATTSFFDAGVTGSYYFSAGTLKAFVEAGVGGMYFVHPTETSSKAGVGPLVGIGASLGRLGLGWRVLWSPPGGQTEEDNTSTHVIASVLTLNLVW